MQTGRAIEEPAGAAMRDEDEVRELAVRQIERKRRFQGRALAYGVLSVAVTLIWAVTEYNNAGGWPSSGFSQSSSIPHTWNVWIIYPLVGLGLALTLHAWNTFGRKPISEREIQREVDRIRGTHQSTS
jgi:protein-S-isoprenylcysteine O-methyltransferase Ste14